MKEKIKCPQNRIANVMLQMSKIVRCLFYMQFLPAILGIILDPLPAQSTVRNQTPKTPIWVGLQQFRVRTGVGSEWDRNAQPVQYNAR